MTDIPEFIVESVDIPDETLKFFNDIQKLNSKETQALNGGIPKRFTSLATTSTIFRWKFGDEISNPTVETTINPYIHTFPANGTYLVSHQSCYPCLVTGTLICSNDWCTKSIDVYEVTGNASFTSTPAGARIWIDGIDQNVTTPSTISGLSPGSHNYVLKLQGYYDTSGSFLITSGSTSLITVNLTMTNTICSWITSKGGWQNIKIFDIMTLVSVYLGQMSIGFTVTSSHIMGCVAYYLGNKQSGDSLTGCNP